jgi:outer membrane protein assembly factor BamD (BamD/ComL family)
MSGKFALIIGNTDYTDPGLAQLTAPGKDAEGFARVLQDPDCCGFDEVKTSLNQVSSSVLEAIDEFFYQRRPDDLLILYFSGHGIRDEFGSLYLAFKNTIRSRLRSTAIKADYIREAMDQSRSKRQVLILDCCNSGAFPQGTKAEVGSSMGMMRALQGYGRYVLTASDATQFAWEGEKIIGATENSLFTHYLVKGLEGEADSDGDGRITVDELYDYAFDEISKVTPNQTPTKSASKQAGEIVLRQITRIEETRPVSLPSELMEATEDSRPFVREGAVDQLEKLLKGRNLGRARSAKEALERMASEDDSFRVRQAAAQALAPIHQAEQKAKEERKAKEETERLAVLKVEAERQAADQEISALERKVNLDAWYQSAVRAIEAGRWEDAQELLQGLQVEEPAYPGAQELLTRVEGEISRSKEQRQQQERINSLYEQARELIRAHQWKEALRILDNIHSLNDQFIDTDRLTEEAKVGLRREERTSQRQEQAAALYSEAVGLLNRGRYQEALENWNHIQIIDPKYKDPSHVKSIATGKLGEITRSAASSRPWAFFEHIRTEWLILLAAVGFGLSRFGEAIVFHGTIPGEIWWVLQGATDGLITALVVHNMLRVWSWKAISIWVICWAAPFAASLHVLPGAFHLLSFSFTLALAPTVSVLAVSRLTGVNRGWATHAKILVGWVLAWMIGQVTIGIGSSLTYNHLWWAICDAISGGIGLWITVDLLHAEARATPAEDQLDTDRSQLPKSEWLMVLAFLSILVIRAVGGVIQAWLRIWDPGSPIFPKILEQLMLGGLYGTVVALAFRKVLRNWGLEQSLTVIIGWALGFGFALFAGQVRLDFILVVMAFCGISVAGAIKWARRSTSPLTMTSVFVFWALSWKLGRLLGDYLQPTFDTDFTWCLADGITILFGLLTTLAICEYRSHRLVKLTLLAAFAFAVGNYAAAWLSANLSFDPELSRPLALAVWGFIGGFIFAAHSRRLKRMLMLGAMCALGLILGYYAARLLFSSYNLPPHPDRYIVLANFLGGVGLGLAFSALTRRPSTIVMLALLGSWMFVITSVSVLVTNFIPSFFYEYVINSGNGLYDAVRGVLIGLVLGFSYAYATRESREPPPSASPPNPQQLYG